MTLRASACQITYVLGATHLQKRRVAKRITAIATALILLCVGLFARHHEGETAHAREHSGRVVHAHAVADHHGASTSAHLHARDVHSAHAGECSLLAIAHAPALHVAAPVVATPAASTTVLLAAAPSLVSSSTAAYRLAPKTSPPSA